MTIGPASLRHAVRRWRHRPGLAVTATLILALGIGATTAMYSMVDAVLLREEPWPDAGRVVRVYAVQPQQRSNPVYRTTWNRSDLSWDSWRDLQRLPLFADVAAWVVDRQIVGDGQGELVRTFYASSTLPLILGARPAHGRFFHAGEDEKDSGAAILSHRLWVRAFGADPTVIGKTTTVTPPGGAVSPSRTRTIVGVLPESFTFPGDAPDILLPIGFHKYNASFATNRFLRVIGRLQPEVSPAAASVAAEPLVRRELTADQRTGRVVTLTEDRIGLGDRPLWLMLAGAALLLIVACSNVAGLLLGDARTRKHESAVRLALGGSRGAIVRQLMLEHGVLALVAAASGVLLAAWLLPSLTALAPPGLLGDREVTLDWRVAGGAIATTVIATLVAGLIPSTAVSSARAADALKASTREMTLTGRWRHRVVVAAQLSLALVLLVGAALFGETLLRLGNQPLGFSPNGAVIVSVSPARRQPISPGERAQNQELARLDFNAMAALLRDRNWAPVESLMERLRTLPAVRAVAVADSAPFTTTTTAAARVRREGQRPEDALLVSYRRVSPQFFEAMGIRVVSGQTFAPSDRGPAPIRLPPNVPPEKVFDVGPVLISADLERRLFDGAAVGKSVILGNGAYQVIGVVENVRHRGIADDELAAMYMPFSQPEFVRHIIVRAADDVTPLLPSLRQAIERHSTPMFVTAIVPLADLVSATIVVERSRALLSGLYGAAALLLGSVGLYGLAARLVAERRREIGIRVALGASPHHIRRLVSADAALIVAMGLVVGVPLAIGASRLAQGMLYGVTPAAPHAFGIAAVALAIASFVATIVPSWRANRIDPAVTLREE